MDHPVYERDTYRVLHPAKINSLYTRPSRPLLQLSASNHHRCRAINNPLLYRIPPPPSSPYLYIYICVVDLPPQIINKKTRRSHSSCLYARAVLLRNNCLYYILYSLRIIHHSVCLCCSIIFNAYCKSLL